MGKNRVSLDFFNWQFVYANYAFLVPTKTILMDLNSISKFLSRYSSCKQVSGYSCSTVFFVN